MNKRGQSYIQVLGILIVIAIVTVAVFGYIAYGFIYVTTSGEDTITVKEKWVKYQNTDAYYLVSTTDNEVYSIIDSLTRWQWRSSNLYACIEPGKTYQISYYGFRFGFFSDYKNIYYLEGCKIR